MTNNIHLLKQNKKTHVAGSLLQSFFHVAVHVLRCVGWSVGVWGCGRGRALRSGTNDISLFVGFSLWDGFGVYLVCFEV